MIKKGDIINVVVKDFAFGGKGIATYKVDDKSIIVFINQGIPGQQLNVLIKKKKPTFLEAEIIEIITPSKLENKVPYQRISGAPYISLSINDQRSMKEQVSFDVYKGKSQKSQNRKIESMINMNFIQSRRKRRRV